MPGINQKIHNILTSRRKTLAIAESCTGGLASSLLTKIPGSSKYFILGAITYSNKAKEKILKIPHKILSAKGAVSEETATLMAKNIRKIAGTDFGVGITGIAGPGGGTTDKPVGTVFIAISSKNKTTCQKFAFSGNRNKIQLNAALKALELLKNRTVPIIL
ncbi:CinA family protein [bacterium]|nr:MAG: CinA family protein [bacterium]